MKTETSSTLPNPEPPLEAVVEFPAEITPVQVGGRLRHPDLLIWRQIDWGKIALFSASLFLFMLAIVLMKEGAGSLVQAIIGDLGTAGGHGTMAGGQVRLDDRDPEMLARQISQSVLTYFNISPEETSRSLLQ